MTSLHIFDISDTCLTNPFLVVTEPKYPLATATHVRMMACVLMIGVNTFVSVEITSLEETAIKVTKIITNVNVGVVKVILLE